MSLPWPDWTEEEWREALTAKAKERGHAPPVEPALAATEDDDEEFEDATPEADDDEDDDDE